MNEEHTGELLRIADDERRARAKAATRERLEKRDEKKKYGDPVIEATINAPHTIAVHGRAVAINVVLPVGPAPGAAGPSGASLIFRVVIGGVAADVRITTAEVV